MFASLTRPNYPRAAIGFGNKTVSAVALRKEGTARYSIKSAATAEISTDILSPSFDESNIIDTYRMVEVLDSLVIESGLGGQKKWSVSVPSASARTAIITLDDAPASKTELEDVLDWKTETAFGVPAGELRVSRLKISLSADSKIRYFASAIRLSNLDEFERVFDELGWQVGLVLPRAIGESNWFSNFSGDSLLISTQEDGFTALLMRNQEPVVVRSVTCAESEKDDEVYRLLVYYQDRFAPDAGKGGLDHLMVLGDGMDRERVRKITVEATGDALDIVRPDELGFEIPSGGLSFEDLAAPAGLAALGWN